MRRYYRPIPTSKPHPSQKALPLAGGWCWFSQVVVGMRDGSEKVMAATDLPQDILTNLTASRAHVASMDMDRPCIMGILNVTPDSFSDGGRFADSKDALVQALAMVQAGADIIDIGGESTRPGAKPVGEVEEIARTVPVIERIRAESDIPISIDTRKAGVAQAAINAGADLINDVAAFTYDPQMINTVAASERPICLMHAQGDPQTMQDDPRYDHVLFDVYDFLEERINTAEAAGIPRRRIIVDPGIGFGKTLEHNLTLLRGLALFHSLGCPILLGASRKRFIGVIGGGDAATDRVAGSVAVALHGIRQGVQILRVHDTFETKQAIDLERAIQRAEQT